MSERNSAAKLVVTRVSDTNVYAAGDVIGSATAAGGAVLEFGGIVNEKGHIIITDHDLLIGLSSVTSGMTSFRLHLYSVTPPSAYGDNTAWDLPSGDRSAYLGYLDLGTPIDVGSSLFVQTGIVNKKIWVNSEGAGTTNAGGSLFGYLVTNGTYTPASGTTYQIRLNAVGA